MHQHHHKPKNESHERRLFWAMVLIGVFALVEVIGGFVSGSLALLADAVHMFTDFFALSLAWFAFRVTRRAADGKRTFGYHRFQVLAAFTNGLLLFAVAAWICVEAFHRLREPVEILSGLMFAVAVVGLVINLLVLKILSHDHSHQHNLNMKGAVLHVIGDILGSVAAIGAAVVIYLTGWLPIDPILSVVVAVIILWSAWGLVKKSSHILLEGAPEGIDPDEIKRTLIEKVPGVIGVHHFHAWSLSRSTFA